MTSLAQSTPVAADHTAEIARLNEAARAGSLPTSRTVFTRALADILAGDAEDPGARQASLMLGLAALRRLINETPIEPGNDLTTNAILGLRDAVGCAAELPRRDDHAGERLVSQ